MTGINFLSCEVQDPNPRSGSSDHAGLKTWDLRDPRPEDPGHADGPVFARSDRSGYSRNILGSVPDYSSKPDPRSDDLTCSAPDHAKDLGSAEPYFHITWLHLVFTPACPVEAWFLQTDCYSTWELRTGNNLGLVGTNHWRPPYGPVGWLGCPEN